MPSGNIGRPKSRGQPMVLKPYLSDEAIAFMKQLPNKADFVAQLIESKVQESPIMNAEVQHYVQKAQEEMEMTGIVFDRERMSSPHTVYVTDKASAMAQDWEKYLKVIHIEDNMDKVIPYGDTKLIRLKTLPYDNDHGLLSWYLVLNGDAAFALHHVQYLDECHPAHACSLEDVPAYLLAGLDG